MMTRWKLHRTGEEEVKFTKKEKKSKEREREKIMKQLCDGARSHSQSARA